MEKSYNVPRLTRHCRLVNFIYLGSICSFGRTENTIKAKLTIIQTNKNMEPKEQAVHRCNFFWDSDSSKEKAEKVSFSTLWVINSHVCSCNVCHKEVFPPPACGVNVLLQPCITKKTQTLHSSSYYGMYEDSCDYFKAPPWLEPGTSCIICPGRQEKKRKASWKIPALKLRCATHHLGAWKRGGFFFSPLKFLPQHLSLTLMSRLSWNSTSPGAKITHIPKAATGGREADPKTKEEGWKKIYI